MVEQLDLGANEKEREKELRETISELADFEGLGRTDVPAVMGIVTSKTIILAVKIVASGTTDDGSHNTFPTSK